MQRFASILAVLILLAGCAGAGTTAPVPAASPAAVTTAAPAASPTTAARTPAPSASPTVVSARLTFDGRQCVYTGPTVITAPAVLRLEYAPTPAQEQSSVFWTPARSDTTQADVDRVSADPSYGIYQGNAPEWALTDHMEGFVGSDTQDVSLQVWHPDTGGTYDEYVINCWTNVETASERNFGPGAILQLVDRRPPAPSRQGGRPLGAGGLVTTLPPMEGTLGTPLPLIVWRLRRIDPSRHTGRIVRVAHPEGLLVTRPSSPRREDPTHCEAP
jgi:hypothetical protein